MSASRKRLLSQESAHSNLSSVSSFHTKKKQHDSHTQVQSSTEPLTTSKDEQSNTCEEPTLDPSPSLYRAEGLFAVYKPLNWTSQDVVAYIRGIITRDAKDRGVEIPKSKKSKGRVKVGHGGTLDPLACGVLVIGVGNGTKALDAFLSGSKSYRASAKLGYETTTLDMEGEVTFEESYDHVTEDSIQTVVPSFVGKIQQVPPIYSAIRRNGKKLYEVAREGVSAEDVNLEPREVEIFNLSFLPQNHMGETFPCFGLDVECGGGTYIRSLVRDIGLSLKTRATMTHLIRTRQGPFLIQDALTKDEWNPERIAQVIRSVP
jgi:tRNA pseudouridine55 synthase